MQHQVHECVPQPVILYNEKQAFITIEKGSVLFEVEPEEAVSALFCTFYTFNIAYTPGCKNVFRLLERVFLNTLPHGKGQNLQKLGWILSKLYPLQ